MGSAKLDSSETEKTVRLFIVISNPSGCGEQEEEPGVDV